MMMKIQLNSSYHVFDVNCQIVTSLYNTMIRKKKEFKKIQSRIQKIRKIYE
jgi:two-component sensor histidine kinase